MHDLKHSDRMVRYWEDQVAGYKRNLTWANDQLKEAKKHDRMVRRQQAPSMGKRRKGSM